MITAMSLPKISLITPSYNQGQYLENTLKSVLDQNYPNLEYIVIDGGSQDHSVDIIEKYSSQLTYWISEPDQGQTDALQKGFSKATGDILGWLCSDDILQPNTLSEVAQFFGKNPDAQIVYGDSLWIDPKGNLIRPRKEHSFSRYILLYSHNFISQPSTFWTRQVYEQVGGLDSKFDVAMDADLWLRFSEVAELHHVQKLWSCMRIYPEQKTYRLFERREAEKKQLRERYYGSEPNWLVASKRAVAKFQRTTLKLSSGCYW